jgi:hypothetical protein
LINVLGRHATRFGRSSSSCQRSGHRRILPDPPPAAAIPKSEFCSALCAAENYGIDKICDYIADIEANTKIVDNPARKKANASVRAAEEMLATAERELAALLADLAVSRPSRTPG